MDGCGNSILQIAGIVVYPRQRHPVVRWIWFERFCCYKIIALGRISQIHFIEIDIVKRFVKVLLAATLQELRFYFHVRYFCYCDGARLHKCTVTDVAVKYHLRLDNIRSVDMPEDCYVSGASL